MRVISTVRRPLPVFPDHQTLGAGRHAKTVHFTEPLANGGFFVRISVARKRLHTHFIALLLVVRS